MDLTKWIDGILQKGFTATTGGFGVELIITHSAPSTALEAEALAVGAVLLSVATVTAFLMWKARVDVLAGLTKNNIKALTDALNKDA